MLAAKLNLDRAKVYKWIWDRRKRAMTGKATLKNRQRNFNRNNIPSVIGMIKTELAGKNAEPSDEEID